MAFLLAGICHIKLFSDDQAQHAITEELEPFIIARGPADTRMRQSQSQQGAVLEFIADAFGEFLIFRFREADHGVN